MTNDELVQELAQRLGVTLKDAPNWDVTFKNLEAEFGVEVEQSDRDAVRNGGMTIDFLRKRLEMRRDNKTS